MIDNNFLFEFEPVDGLFDPSLDFKVLGVDDNYLMALESMSSNINHSIPYDNTKKSNYDINTKDGLANAVRQAPANVKIDPKKAQTYIADPIYTGIKSSNFDRYYKHPSFDRLGWHPYASNIEEYYNKNSTMFADYRRMLSQFGGLMATGFMSGYRSIGDALKGDFTAPDLKSSQEFQDAMRIGNTGKTGLMAWGNDFLLNSAFTFGIIGSIAAEELAIAAASAAVTATGVGAPLGIGGFAAATGRNFVRGVSAVGSLFDITRMGNATRQMVRGLNNVDTARNFYALTVLGKGTANFFAPETMAAIRYLNSTKNGVQNLSNLAKVGITFGGFYRDLRSINLALAESKLEGGLVYDEQLQTAINLSLAENNGNPLSSEQMKDAHENASKAAFTTTMINAPLIYLSNKIVLGTALGFFSKRLGRLLDGSTPSLGRKFARVRKGVDANGRPVRAEFDANGKLIRETAVIDDISKKPFKERLKYYTVNGSAKVGAHGALRYFAANLAEGFQELAQEATSHGTQEYYTELYKDPGAAGMNLLESSFRSGIGSQMGKEGFSVFMSGFLMGGLVQGPQKLFFEKVPQLYSKHFDKKKYDSYKDARAKYEEALITNYNKIHNELADDINAAIFNNEKLNFLAQKQAVADMKEASVNNDIFNFIDIQDYATFQNAYTIYEAGTSELFIDQLKGYASLTDAELVEAFPEQKEEVENGTFRKNIDKRINQIRDTQAFYNASKDKLKNPYTPDAYKGIEKVKEQLRHRAYEHARYLYLFTQDGFKRALERSNSIYNSLASEPIISKIAANDLTILLDKESISNEIQMIAQELSVMTHPQTETDKKIISDKKQKAKALANFLNVIENPENLNQDGSYNFDKIDKLKKSFQEYVQFLADSKKDFVNHDMLDDTLKKIVDYTHLEARAKVYDKAIVYMNNPEAIDKIVNAAYDTYKNIYETHKVYFKESIKHGLDIIEMNEFLNQLGEIGVYPLSENLDAFIASGDIQDLGLIFLTDEGQVVIGDGSSQSEEIMALIKRYQIAKNQTSEPDVDSAEPETPDDESQFDDVEPQEEDDYDDVNPETDEFDDIDSKIDPESRPVSTIELSKQPKNIQALIEQLYNKYRSEALQNNEVPVGIQEWLGNRKNAIKAGAILRIIGHYQNQTGAQDLSEFGTWLDNNFNELNVRLLLGDSELKIEDFKIKTASPAIEDTGEYYKIGPGLRIKIVTVQNPTSPDKSTKAYKLVDEQDKAISSDQLAKLTTHKHNLFFKATDALSAYNQFLKTLPSADTYLFDGMTLKETSVVEDIEGNKYVVLGTGNSNKPGANMLLIPEEDYISMTKREMLVSKTLLSEPELDFSKRFKKIPETIEETFEDTSSKSAIARIETGELTDIYPLRNGFSEDKAVAKARLNFILNNLTPEETKNLIVWITPNANPRASRNFALKNTDPNPYVFQKGEAYTIKIVIPQSAVTRLSDQIAKLYPVNNFDGTIAFISNFNYTFLKGKETNLNSFSKNDLEYVFVNDVEEGLAEYNTRLAFESAISNLMENSTSKIVGINDIPGINISITSGKLNFAQETSEAVSLKEMANNKFDGQFVIMTNLKAKDGSITPLFVTDAGSKSAKLEQKVETELKAQGLYDLAKSSGRYIAITKDSNGYITLVQLKAKDFTEDAVNQKLTELLNRAKKTVDENLISDTSELEQEKAEIEKVLSEQSTDIETKKADIEKRRQEELEFNFGKSIELVSSGRTPVIERQSIYSKKYPKGTQLANYEAAKKLVDDYKEINAKYDAELDALDSNTNQQQTQAVEQQKADIERRRQESNKNQLNEIGSNRFLKLNKEGENTELSEVELKLINSLIDKMISQGKSAKEINAELISRGFIQSQATTPAQIETYLQSRIDGKINSKVGESISQEINAKYDAEIDALNNQATSQQQVEIERRKEEDFQNENESYRVIVGDEAFNDIVESGVVRTNANNKGGQTLAEKLAKRPTLYPSFSKGSASMEYANANPNNYIIVTEDSSIQPSTSGRHGKGTTMFPTDENGKHLTELSGEKIKVYKHIGNGEYVLVYDKGKQINAKYDAELADLEESTAGTFTPITPENKKTGYINQGYNSDWNKEFRNDFYITSKPGVNLKIEVAPWGKIEFIVYDKNSKTQVKHELSVKTVEYLLNNPDKLSTIFDSFNNNPNIKAFAEKNNLGSITLGYKNFGRSFAAGSSLNDILDSTVTNFKHVPRIEKGLRYTADPLASNVEKETGTTITETKKAKPKPTVDQILEGIDNITEEEFQEHVKTKFQDVSNDILEKLAHSIVKKNIKNLTEREQALYKARKNEVEIIKGRLLADLGGNPEEIRLKAALEEVKQKIEDKRKEIEDRNLEEGSFKAFRLETASLEKEKADIIKRLTDLSNGAFKIVSELSQEEIEKIDVFTDWVKGALPDFISVSEVDEFKHRLLNGNINVGMFVASLNNISNNAEGRIITGATSPFKYHEAFHAVFRLLLTDAQITKYLTIGEKELRAKLRKENKIFNQELEKFKNSHPYYATLSPQRLKEEFVEEYLGDQFDKFKMNPKSATTDGIIKSIFNKIISWIKTVFARFTKNELNSLYDNIAAGKYRNYTVQDNRFVKSLQSTPTLTAYKNLPIDVYAGMKGVSYEYLDPELSTFLIGSMAARYLEIETLNTDIPKYEILDTVIEEYYTLYDPNAKRYAKAPLSKLIQVDTIQKAILYNGGRDLMEAVAEYLNVISGQESENNYSLDKIENDQGLRGVNEWDKDASLIGGFSSLPINLKRFLATTTIEEPDFIGNTTVNKKGDKLIVPIDFEQAYNGLLKAVQNKYTYVDILIAIHEYGKSNRYTGAVAKRFFDMWGISAEDLVETKQLPDTVKRPGFFMQTMKALQNARVNYMFIHRDRKSGRLLHYSAASRDAAKSQIDTWNERYQYLKNTKPNFKQSAKTTFEALKDALDNPRPKMKNLALEKKAKKLQEKLYNNLGFSFSTNYLKRVLIEGLEERSKAQDQLVNFNKDVYIITSEDVHQLMVQLQNNANIFSDIEGEGNKARILKMALGNSVFDESIGTTVFKNANGDFVYSHQIPTYHLKAISRLNDPEKLEELKENLYLETNLLLNSPAFKAMSEKQKIEILRISGNKVSSIDDTDFGVEELSQSADDSSSTYGDFTAKDFIMSLIESYTNGYNTRKEEIEQYIEYTDEYKNRVKVALSPVLIRVLEASNTGDLTRLPVIKTIERTKDQKDSVITEKTLDLFMEEVKRDYDRMVRENKAVQEKGFGNIKGYNDQFSDAPGKGRAFKFGSINLLLNEKSKKDVKDVIDITESKIKSSYFQKDQAKFANANKLIARGSANSSSNAYSVAAKDKANVGNYTSTDIVAISAEGNRNDRIAPDFVEIQKAIDAGVTFITDNAYNRSRSFNIGEREVADYLSKNGYVETQDGIWNKKNIYALTNSEVQYQLPQNREIEEFTASEKTIRDLAARMSDRIGIPVRFESDRTKQYKGKIENNTAVVNLAYATLDTPIHEILGHAIIRAIRNKNRIKQDEYSIKSFTYKGDNYKTEKDIFGYSYKNGEIIGDEQFNKIAKEYLKEGELQSSQLYQNLLKELEYGKGKEILDRIKRDYRYKNATEEQIKSDELYVSLGVESSLTKYTLEEQQEEAIVTLLGLMVAEKLDKVKDGKLISLLKRLLKEMKAFIKELITGRVDVDRVIQEEVTYTNEEGNPCAKMGSRNSKFTKGSKWEIVKDLKNYPSHAQGGVDVKLGKNGFSFTRNNGVIEAKHGLVLPKIK